MKNGICKKEKKKEIDIKCYTSSLNEPIIDISNIYFIKSADWISTKDSEGFEFEYKECTFYANCSKVVLELVSKGYAYDIKFDGDDIKFKMLKKY